MACSSVEIADRIAVVEGVKQEEKSTVAQRCARIYAECNPKPGTVLQIIYGSQLVQLIRASPSIEAIWKELSHLYTRSCGL